LFRPILEYACTVWYPYHEQNIYKLEMVQRRAARFVINNYNRTASVSEMFNTLRWHTLEKRRDSLRTILLYKIIHNMVEINAREYLRKEGVLYVSTLVCNCINLWGFPLVSALLGILYN